MEKILRKGIVWSKKKIISLVLGGLVILISVSSVLVYLTFKNKSFNLIGNYMDVTGVNNETLFVAKNTIINNPVTMRLNYVLALEEDKVYNDESLEYQDAENVQFVVLAGDSYNRIKFYGENNRIEDANDYVKELAVPKGWYVSTYSIAEKFIFVKYQYNFDGVKFIPTKKTNDFGSYVSPLEFHSKNHNSGHEVIAIDRNTGLITSVVDVMVAKNYLIETPNLSSNQAGQMVVIEYDYSTEDSNIQYCLGMYRGEVYVISSDETGELIINKIITLDELKDKIRIELEAYMINNPSPNGITYEVSKYLNSEKSAIEYSGDNLNFFIDKNGNILVFFAYYNVINNDQGYQLTERIYGAGYTIDANNEAIYINPKDSGGYTIIDSGIIGNNPITS